VKALSLQSSQLAVKDRGVGLILSMIVIGIPVGQGKANPKGLPPKPFWIV
jgi:hypothetical protein